MVFAPDVSQLAMPLGYLAKLAHVILHFRKAASCRLPGRYDAGKPQDGGDLRRKYDQLETEHVPNRGSGYRDATSDERSPRCHLGLSEQAIGRP